jgi:hypothetical protein
LLYGGAAGGGKTDLVLGASRLKHHRSIIFRRTYPALSAIIDRARRIYNPDGINAAKDSYNEQLHRWRFQDGSQIRFGSIQYEKDVFNWQGQAYDLHCFDELCEFTESQFRYVTTWNRSTRLGQRCRIICTCNPPTSTEGEWVIRYFAPWLDRMNPHPAKPGELRWFTTIGGEDREVTDKRPFIIKDDEPCYDYPATFNPDDLVYPKSRTFIPAKLVDNPYLLNSGYGATLQALPEPLRSQMLFGDFSAGTEDAAFQVIPSEWVRLAIERWRKLKKPTTHLNCLGVDVARGGKDKTVLTLRYDNYFDTQLAFPGSSTPDGEKVAGLILKTIAENNGSAGTRVNIDVIGVGSSPYDFTYKQHASTYAMNGAAKSIARDKSQELAFVNQRAELYWKLREALDPSSGQDIALPDDRELAADLCSARWELTVRGIKIEAKEDIQERIGRSPDKGDSLVYASANVTAVGDNINAYYVMLGQKGKANGY